MLTVMDYKLKQVSWLRLDFHYENEWKPMDTLNQNAFKLQKDTNTVYSMISRDVKYMWLLANGLNALITRSTKDFYNNFVQGKNVW